MLSISVPRRASSAAWAGSSGAGVLSSTSRWSWRRVLSSSSARMGSKRRPGGVRAPPFPRAGAAAPTAKRRSRTARRGRKRRARSVRQPAIEVVEVELRPGHELDRSGGGIAVLPAARRKAPVVFHAPVVLRHEHVLFQRREGLVGHSLVAP